MQQYPPVYGPPPPQQPPRDRTALIVLLAVAAVFVLVVIAVVVVIVVRAGGGEETPQLRRPLGIQQVTEVTPGACTDGSGVPAFDGTECYRLAPGMTVTRVERIEAALSPNGGSGWHVQIDLVPADGTAFGSLTRQVAGEQSPRNQLALVVDGRVVSAPAVQEAITGGQVQISSNFSRQEAERLVRQMTGAG
ncbi:SecDF P1 head subdomain-containing protein [Actinomadura alba]|uniref:SecDF P1 head subdomain domain-containing protein n=1 Tax=Actinomadura alba TaxID=406431 RepID=A0ABR7LX99_9ACTN|nr:hypothetical protein [Actinomadura alba]MBC6469075.1 hypothetical protein [Actinomadura alba]